MEATLVVRIAGGSLLALAAFAAHPQARPPTTEQLGKDPGALRQEAERQQSQQMQQQQQQSQQQQDQLYNDTVRQNQSRAAADAAQGEAVRRTWAQRPPLAPDHNPLLGRWESLGVGKRGSTPGLSPEMAQLANALLGGITAGMCDSMLGRGTVEFRPNGVVAIGKDGREHAMYRAEYRGGGSRVVVLPQGGTNFTHMIIDFNGADHATVAAVGCSLARTGGGTAKTALTNTAMAGADSGPAVQWKMFAHVPTNGGFDVYVAPDSVRRAGDKARMLNLFDFKTRQMFEGKAFLSARNEYEYDCGARPRHRLLATSGFSGNMGKGAVVATSDGSLPWQPVASSGPDHESWLIACKRQ